MKYLVPSVALVALATSCSDVDLDATAPSSATQAIVGDGVLEDPEECDDGNTQDGDGCSAAGLIEAASLNVCATGDEGVVTIGSANTVLNSYFPGTNNAARGATSITVGARRGLKHHRRGRPVAGGADAGGAHQHRRR